MVNTTATNTVTIPAPVGTNPGDVLVACLATNGGNVTSSGTPTGWQPLATVTGISNPHTFGYYKIAGTEPTNYAWTLTSSVANSAGIARYSGVNTTNPLAATTTTATNAASTTATLPALTTTTDNAMIIGCLAANTSSTSVTLTSPTGMTQAWDLAGKRHELADTTQPTAGTTGPKTWTLSAARATAGWLTALRPGSTTPAAPDTVIDSGPSGSVASASASFGFSSSSAGASFGCSLDGAAFTACTSPRSYQGLAEGPHTFQVRATDTTGTTDPTPATRTWTVDTTAPTLTATTPTDSATDVAVDANTRATFNEAINPATVTTTTFTLTRTSDQAPV